METLDVKETAELMRVSADTVYELINNGDLPACQIGRSWVLLRSDVIDYIRRQVQSQTQDRRRSREVETATSRPAPRRSHKRRPPALEPFEQRSAQ